MPRWLGLQGCIDIIRDLVAMISAVSLVRASGLLKIRAMPFDDNFQASSSASSRPFDVNEGSPILRSLLPWRIK